MYEVDVRVCDTGVKEEIQRFFDMTKNFGKRFYNIDYNDEEEAQIRVTALAVSRDLTYILRWVIRCKRTVSEEDMDGFPWEGLVTGEVPAYGWEPKFEEVKKVWWPQHYKKIFFDVFHLNGFVYAENLKKDGVSITNWNVLD